MNRDTNLRRAHPERPSHGHNLLNGNAKRPEEDPEDTTTPHPNQLHWSIESLPSVLYVLRPGSQYVKSRARVRETNFKIFGKRVREFQVLPRQISSRVEGWRLEAWWRLDRRIEAQDILDRIDPKFGVTALDLEMRREEFRRAFHVANWKSQASINGIARLVQKKRINLGLNTTRGLTPGLIDPAKGEEGGRIPTCVMEKAVDTSRSWPFFVMRGLERPSISSSSRLASSRDMGSPFPEWQSIKPTLVPGQVSNQGVSPRQLPNYISYQAPSQKRQVENWNRQVEA